jgi:mono/diheme cytochrome c family protein
MKRRSRPRGLRLAALTFAGLVLLSGCAGLVRLSGRSEAMHDYTKANPRADVSQARFLWEDFGTLGSHSLETVATPWKLAVTALLLDQAPALGLPIERASLRPVLEGFGFLYPDSIGNWRDAAAPRPRIEGPLGVLRGMARPPVPGYELEVANLGCASCHAGTLFNAEGAPTNVAWLGVPNHSLDLGAYARAVFRGLGLVLADEKGALATMERLFPEMSGSEKRTMQNFVFPQLRRRWPVLARTTGLPVPFDNGGPGYTNGVAAFKFQVGKLDTATSVSRERGFVSIPSLWSRPFRRSLLVDGIYARPETPRFGEVAADTATRARQDELAHIAAFVTVGTAGNSLAGAERAIPRMQEALRFLADERPPRFPGPIDSVKARAGQAIFALRCSGCHGAYDESIDRPRLQNYPNRLLAQAEIGTDSVRWSLVDAAALSAHDKTWRPFDRQISAVRTGGYVAPLLTGLWATAPYLHNGSVPTLWHLMHPDERPQKFMVGGQRYDFEKVGIALVPGEDGVAHYPEGYIPPSRPAVYDTRLPGLANTGHTRPFARLSEDERAQLLEYLKTL